MKRFSECSSERQASISEEMKAYISDEDILGDYGKFSGWGDGVRRV